MTQTNCLEKNPAVEIEDKTIAVWVSCGAASAVGAKMTVDKYGKNNNVILLNTPIKEEDSDNRRFLSDIENWVGQKIQIVTASKWPNSSAVEVWDKVKYMSGIHGAPCTKQLKKEARYEWEEANKPDYHVLGFTFDEKTRHDSFVITEIPNVIPVLIDAEVTKADCFAILKFFNIPIPRIYKLQYPNANCIGCVKATSPTYWNHVRKMHPEIFEERAEQSRRIGARLVRVNGKRLFLDQLPLDAKGRSMKNMNFECGIFCEITN